MEYYKNLHIILKKDQERNKQFRPTFMQKFKIYKLRKKKKKKNIMMMCLWLDVNKWERKSLKLSF